MVLGRGLGGLVGLGLVAGGLMVAWLVNASFAVGKPDRVATSGATITVTLGKPSEFAFKLSKAQVPAGSVVFTVTNSGKRPHNFKVCARATASSNPNACVGEATPTLMPGKSATLRVVFATSGSYEFLSSVAGQAKAGMKGLLVVGKQRAGVGTTTTSTKPAATTSAAATTTASTTTSGTSKPPATEALVGNPSNGASVFASAGCASCHTLAAAGATGTVGPNLDQLAPDQAVIVTQVTNGGFNMPSFGASLTASQINDLAAYVYQSTHT